MPETITVDEWLAFMMIRYDNDDEAYKLITMIQEIRDATHDLKKLDAILLDVLQHDVRKVN